MHYLKHKLIHCRGTFIDSYVQALENLNLLHISVLLERIIKNVSVGFLISAI